MSHNNDGLDGMHMDFSDFLIEQYKVAAGEGAAVELRLRLLAAKITEMQQHSISSKLEHLEEKLAEYFGNKLSEEERETLQLCRQLRNKILHGDFRSTRNKLAELGVETTSSGTISTSIPGLNAKQLLERIDSIAGGEKTHVKLITDSPSEDIFGWLLEVSTSGDFEQAVNIFVKASALVNRLTDELDANAG